jgi:hypothetical protein
VYSSGTTIGQQECFAKIQPRITQEMNLGLTRLFTPDEVDIALAQMPALKAPGPNGFGVSFFNQHWDTTGDTVRGAVLNFLNNGIFDPAINATYLALIPKVSPAISVHDFRPISLCNVIYKLISKVLANRLKVVLPKVISKYQSAFVPGRLITDNILVAYETLHTMATRMKGRKGYMAIKVDMSKTYDRVEWSFLEGMMNQLGFAEKWVSLVMRCVKTVSYSILVNGGPTESFKPTRGIRQGDPLSLYLFLLCVECLNSMMVIAEQAGRISGIPIAANGVRVSHLFFADDSLLFCRANFMEWGQMLNLVKRYELASGQQLNTTKTSIFFSKNTGRDFRDLIGSAVGETTTHGYEQYLGLPAMVGRAKLDTFAGILRRVQARLDGWKERLLSQAGREILLKAVIQSISAYSISVFFLPKTLCKKLNDPEGEIFP